MASSACEHGRALSLPTIASRVALAVLLGGVPAVAQGQAVAGSPASAATLPPSGTTTGDIVVTGIRASLESAAARKRDSAVVIDSITQEDLGKFPDANVAEALQRIPGIAIDRSSGEGRFVTVRGLGPQFNTVLFNGRSFASDNYGREFSFDLLAAELISGADVYKTSQARLQDGGIGATINLRTVRPFDIDGFRGVATGKALYEANNQKVTPQFFGLLSDTFADDTFGLLASISYQKRIADIRSVEYDGWLPDQTVGPDNAPFFRDVYAPRSAGIKANRDERTRLGATLVGQYRPNDELLMTVDGLYNKFKSETQNRGYGLWFEPSQYTAAAIDDNRTVTSLSGVGNVDFGTTYGVRDTTTYELGFNTEWTPSDQLRLAFDMTTSKAKNDGGGRTYADVVGTATTYSYAASPAGLPTFVVNRPGAIDSLALPRTHVASIGGADVSEKVFETRLDTEWKADGGALTAVRLGTSFTRRTRINQSIQTLNANCFYCGYPTSVPSSLLRNFTVGPIGKGIDVPRTYVSYDPAALIAYLGSADSLAARDQAKGLAPGTSAADLARISNGFGYAAQVNPPDMVSEGVYAGYAEADFEGDLGGVPWLLNLGARYIHTGVRAQSETRSLVDLLPVSGDPTIFNAVYANNGQFVPADVTATYDAFLPTANLRIRPIEDVNIRFGISRTLTRPTLTDLRPVTSFGETRPASLTASGGKPDLRPYSATNLDVSVEWYPTRTTTIAVAGYYKNIDDFIVTTIAPEIVPILNSGNLPVSGTITGPREATAQIARPRNAGSAIVRGVELNVVSTFDWLPSFLSGFGTQLNATFVGTNRTLGDLSPEQRFAVVGIGNSQNATLFYEKYGISARIAYNRRDRFLASIADGQGAEPLFVKTYGQFDASASYAVTGNAQVFVEGTNIFNAKYQSTARFDNQLRAFFNYGARFDAGVRFKF